MLNKKLLNKVRSFHEPPEKTGCTPSSSRSSVTSSPTQRLFTRSARPLKFFKTILDTGDFLPSSTLISLQMFINAPNPKFTPFGPSMNS